MDFFKFKVEKIIILLLVQTLLLLFVTVWRETNLFSVSVENLLNIILFIVIILSVLSMVMIKKLVVFLKKRNNYKIQKIKRRKDQELIEDLRKQKHDFINHLQIIYGLNQLDKKEKIKEYIQSLNEDLVSIQPASNQIKESILEVVLVPKQKQAYKQGIDFYYELDKGINKVQLSLNELFRIIANLVDNALDAVQSDAKNKKIKVRGINRGEKYVLSVYNSGLMIPEDIQKKIFEPGFSTKGDNRGYGLHIIKFLIEQHGGRLELKSKEGFGVQFSCYFSLN